MIGEMYGRLQSRTSQRERWGLVGVPTPPTQLGKWSFRNRYFCWVQPRSVISEVTGQNKVVYWGVLSHAGTKGRGLIQGQYVNCKRISVDWNFLPTLLCIYRRHADLSGSREPWIVIAVLLQSTSVLVRSFNTSTSTPPWLNRHDHETTMTQNGSLESVTALAKFPETKDLAENSDSTIAKVTGRDCQFSRVDPLHSPISVRRNERDSCGLLYRTRRQYIHCVRKTWSSPHWRGW